jgi:hypothetical protein
MTPTEAIELARMCGEARAAADRLCALAVQSDRPETGWYETRYMPAQSARVAIQRLAELAERHLVTRIEVRPETENQT